MVYSFLYVCACVCACACLVTVLFPRSMLLSLVRGLHKELSQALVWLSVAVLLSLCITAVDCGQTMLQAFLREGTKRKMDQVLWQNPSRPGVLTDLLLWFFTAQVSCQLQACRGDLGIPEWLRKSYFSFFFPDMTHFCLGWSLHSASEHRLLAAKVYVKQDQLLKAKNKSKHLYICKEPLCLVCSALVIRLPFQAFLCKKEDQFFFFPPPSKIIFFTAWKAVMYNEGPRCMPSMLGGLMPRSRRY